jgi:hypothetical protein
VYPVGLLIYNVGYIIFFIGIVPNADLRNLIALMKIFFLVINFPLSVNVILSNLANLNLLFITF